MSADNYVGRPNDDTSFHFTQPSSHLAIVSGTKAPQISKFAHVAAKRRTANSSIRILTVNSRLRRQLSLIQTNLPKVIWEDGRVAALSHKYAVKSPLVTMARPKFAPPKYHFSWTDPQTPLPASFLVPSDIWCQTASGSDLSFFHNALDRPTHERTNRPTDRRRESLITIGRCAPRATRPNK